VKHILALAIVCSLALTARTALGVTPGQFSLESTARIVRSDPNTDLDQDAQSGQSPVSASADASEGGTMATADSSAAFNDLHVRAYSAATNFTSTRLLAIATAEWNDRLYFERNGQPVSSGSIVITFHTKGVIDFQPPHATQYLSISLSLNGSGGGIALGQNGAYDQHFDRIFGQRTWSAVDGLAMRFSMSANAGNASNILTALTDFSAGSRITNISLLGPNGQPDPTVKITSSSGVIYAVPEPHTVALAVCLASMAALFRRPR
jgi:hypothetical protein